MMNKHKVKSCDNAGSPVNTVTINTNLMAIYPIVEMFQPGTKWWTSVSDITTIILFLEHNVRGQ